MQSNLKNNYRFLYALGISVWVFAGIHSLILVVYAVKNSDYRVLNLFNILDLEMFFPHIDRGWISAFLSVVIFVSVYFGAYLLFSKQTSRDK